MRRTVAALYVDPESGPYPGLVGRDLCWGVERDAKTYPGPWRVVAHPPCGPWGKLRWNCKHQDASLSPVGVAQVRRWGGVLEHPEGSVLWRECGLPAPFHAVPTFAPREWALAVNQVDFGHQMKKRTWLFFVDVDPRSLPPLPPARIATHVLGQSRSRRGDRLCVPKKNRHITPPAFAEWLVEAVQG
jgi:hypothetical protein